MCDMKLRRRTHARLEFVLAALVLALQLFIWRHQRENTELWHEKVEAWEGPPPVSVSGLAAGAFEEVVRHWAYDFDVGGVRTSRRRGLLFSALRLLVTRRLFPRTETFRYNADVGKLVATLCYRFWFGVLHPLPGSDDR
jgi:hypothetical protein